MTSAFLAAHSPASGTGYRAEPMDDPPLHPPLLVRLADDLAGSIVQRYRVSHDEAIAAILAEWSGRPALLDAARQAAGPDQVKRMRVYRDAAAAVKKDLYYNLRRYRRGPNEKDHGIAALARLDADSPAAEKAAAMNQVVSGHVSTAERLPHLSEFFERLIAMIDVPETVVDVGCGVFPILVPLDGAMHATREYWALEQDQAAVAAVREYARLRGDDRVRPIGWNLAQGWAAAHDAGLPESCEVGLLLKVVPVIARQSAGLVADLAQTPAERLVVSGSRIAMAKRQDIARRETRILRRFFDDHKLTELDSFMTEDEVVFLVQRN